MKDKKDKKRKKDGAKDQEVDRRKFIEKSARDMGACGLAIFDIARTIKTEIIQEVVDDIKKSIKKP